MWKRREGGSVRQDGPGLHPADKGGNEQKDNRNHRTIGIVIGESAQNDTDGEADADRAAESVPQAAQSLCKHHHDGENGTGVRIHIGMDENALGQKNGKTGKDPLRKPVGKQQPGQPSDVNGRAEPKQGIYQPGRNQENVKTVGEETEKP